MLKHDIVFCYGYDYCALSGALYVDGLLVVDDMRCGHDNLLKALGYDDYKELQADQSWLDSDEVCWKFPPRLEDIILAN